GGEDLPVGGVIAEEGDVGHQDAPAGGDGELPPGVADQQDHGERGEARGGGGDQAGPVVGGAAGGAGGAPAGARRGTEWAHCGVAGLEVGPVRWRSSPPPGWGVGPRCGSVKECGGRPTTSSVRSRWGSLGYRRPRAGAAGEALVAQRARMLEACGPFGPCVTSN